MQAEELITRRGEFFQELNGDDVFLYTDSWAEGLEFCMKDDLNCCSVAISLVTYEPDTDNYRGSDYCPEYHPPIPMITYELHRSDLESFHQGVQVHDLVMRLLNDGAETIPLYRHFHLISFLLERPDLITYPTDSSAAYGYKERFEGIVDYAYLDFVIKPDAPQSEPQSLIVAREGSIVAEYDTVRLGALLEEERKRWVHDYDAIRYPDKSALWICLQPKYGDKGIMQGMTMRLHPERYRNYPVYYNMHLIWEIQRYPQLLKPGFSFDNFCRL